MTPKQVSELKAPFEPTEIEWRSTRSGFSSDGKPWAMLVAYIQARAIMDRLDDVLGMDKWSLNHEPFTIDVKEGKLSGVMCTIVVHNEDGSVLCRKSDGAEFTDWETIKGGISGALKRAAVLLGIGRYLYGLEESFGSEVKKGTEGAIMVSIKNKTSGAFSNHYFLPPKLPSWALPAGNVSVTSKISNEEFLEAVQPVCKPGQSQAPDNLGWEPAESDESFIEHEEKVVTVQKEPEFVKTVSEADGFWKEAIIHFGKNANKKLSELTEKQLLWYIENWEPKPWKGEIIPKDAYLRKCLDSAKAELTNLPF